MTDPAATAACTRPRRPATLRLVGGLLACSGTAAAAAVLQRRRSRGPAVRDLLHHRLLPTLQAGERAIASGDIDAATRHLRTAVVLSRTALDPHGTPPEPIVDAIEEARRVWADGLLIDDGGVTALPARLPAPTRRALHAITLESLANVARHRAAPAARVATGTEADHVVLTVAASGPRRDPEGSGGYGLSSLQRITEEAGGSLEASFDERGSIVVARLPRRRLRMRA